ncbi:MAG TPA: hypothetical protein VJ455_08545 [Ignavibacteria bacterium]|nr:hypothetical protein [Ignavibacteria bacterium]
MIKFLAIPFLLSLGIFISYSHEFDSTKTVLITLRDETEIVGHIISKDSANTTIRSLSGVVSVIPKTQIVEITKLKGKIIGNEYYKPDPADNRLMALPTGRPLKSGDVQFNAVELIFPHLIIGASDFLSIGFGGLPFVSSGGGTFIYYMSAKLTPINLKNIAVSIGGAIVGSTSTNGIVGVTYAVSTFGTFQNSLTTGMFFAFSKDELYNRPAILIGGQTRISKSASLLSENVILFGNETESFIMFPSLGIRFSGEKLAADFGTYAVIKSDSFFYPIPWIGLSYKF